MAENKESNIEYFNIGMRGSLDAEEIIPAKFSSNRTTPILDDPSEWIAGLVRFYVPGIYIPVFKWSEKALPDGSDPDLRVYFEFNGVTVIKYVKFIDQSNDPQPTVAGLVWNITDFITMCNVTIQEAFDDIKTEVGFPTAISPQLSYNANSKLISFFSDVLMDSNSGVRFGMSNLLYSYFPCFPVKEEVVAYPGTYVYFFEIFDDYQNNVIYKGVPSYQILGEYQVIALWNGITKLLFASNTLPVNPEMVGGTTDVLERVIFDFILDNSQLNDRSAVEYYNQGGQRFITMMSSFPMKRIDVEILIEFKDGTTIPLRLNSLDKATLKLEFRRKNSISHN
jgi:hypothetical protein